MSQKYSKQVSNEYINKDNTWTEINYSIHDTEENVYDFAQKWQRWVNKSVFETRGVTCPQHQLCKYDWLYMRQKLWIDGV